MKRKEEHYTHATRNEEVKKTTAIVTGKQIGRAHV